MEGVSCCVGPHFTTEQKLWLTGFWPELFSIVINNLLGLYFLNIERPEKISCVLRGWALIPRSLQFNAGLLYYYISLVLNHPHTQGIFRIGRQIWVFWLIIFNAHECQISDYMVKNSLPKQEWNLRCPWMMQYQRLCQLSYQGLLKARSKKNMQF